MSAIAEPLHGHDIVRSCCNEPREVSIRVPPSSSFILTLYFKFEILVISY